jgi:hypothetical protein
VFSLFCHSGFFLYFNFSAICHFLLPLFIFFISLAYWVEHISFFSNSHVFVSSSHKTYSFLNSYVCDCLFLLYIIFFLLVFSVGLVEMKFIYLCFSWKAFILFLDNSSEYSNPVRQIFSFIEGNILFHTFLYYRTSATGSDITLMCFSPKWVGIFFCSILFFVL